MVYRRPPSPTPSSSGRERMQVHKLHPWDMTADEAIALQKQLAGRVDTATPLPADWDLVAGADVSFNRDDPTIYASVLVWRRSTGEVVEGRDAVGESHFPYVPGLLSFREAPTVLAAFARLQTRPDGGVRRSTRYRVPSTQSETASRDLPDWVLGTGSPPQTRLVGFAGPSYHSQGSGDSPGAAATPAPGPWSRGMVTDDPPFALTIPSDLRLLPLARVFLETACVHFGCDRPTTDAVVLACYEALQTVVRHAHRDRPEATVAISCHPTGDGISVVVLDHGEPFDL